MATEITWTRRHRLHPGYVEEVGGPGWSADAATVLGQIGEGREYFVRVGEVQLRVAISRQNGRPALATDPSESAENLLLCLPTAAEQPRSAERPSAEPRRSTR